VTKALALALLHPSVPLGRAWLRLTLTRNVGSAFGLVPGGRVLVVAGLTLSLATLAYVLVGKGLKRHPGRALSLALVFGGAVGNLADRARTGAVTDFIDLTVWPVFNVADIAITLGAALLAINLLRGH
jgi:signal peptidase II